MTRSRTIALVLVAVAAIAVGGYLAYDLVLRGDDVASLTLPSASPTTTETPAASDAAPTLSAPSATTGQVAEGSLGGDWSVAAGSVAGYRVREQLANLPAESDAVGRTEDVSGSITVEQASEIAERKMPDLNANDLDAATKIVAGTARSMGVTVEGM